MTTNNNTTQRKMKANTTFLARKSVPKNSKEKFKWISISSKDVLETIEPVTLNRDVLKDWYDATSQGFDYANIESYKDCFLFGIGKGKSNSAYCQKGSLYLLFDKSIKVYNRLNNTTLICAEGNTDALALISSGIDKYYGVLKRESLQTIPNLEDIPNYTKEIIFIRDEDESKEDLNNKLQKKGYMKLVEDGVLLFTIGYETLQKKDISECFYDAYDNNFELNLEIINDLLLQKKPIFYNTKKNKVKSIKELINMDNMNINTKVPSVVMERIIKTFFDWKYNLVTLDIQIQLKKEEWDTFDIPNKKEWDRAFSKEWTTFDNNYAIGLDRFVKQIVEIEKGTAVSLNDNSIKILTTPDSNNIIDPFSDYFDKIKIIVPTEEYNPLRDALNYITFHIDIEKHRERIVELIGKWLGMAIRCAKGKQVNEIMLILTGDQGAGKTTFFNALIPEVLKDYVTDTLEENKDGSQSLTDSFLAIDDELDGMKRNNLEKLKKRITQSKFKFRPPYGSKSIMRTRRASFIGATNADDFLVDSTGNRRFFCIPVIKNKNAKLHTENMKKLREFDTDLLWSVGKYYAQKPEDLFYTPEEIKFINDNFNKVFEEENVYDQLIKSFLLNSNETNDKENWNFMTPFKILNKIDSINGTNLAKDKYSSNNLGRALKKAGFEKISQYNKKTKYSEYGYLVAFVD
ncbi:MAG: VapE family protein [Candidatus Kapaibacterium sp.]|nr:hypothetical protein [Ignavibacteria bacterium]